MHLYFLNKDDLIKELLVKIEVNLQILKSFHICL